MKISKSLIFLLAVVSRLSVGFDGHDIGHGGDFITTENNPWFIGSEPVTYCLEFSPDFSATADVAERAVARALEDWKSTIFVVAPQPTGARELDGKTRTISTRFVQTDCNPSVDLKFYLGVLSPAIVDELNHRAKYSISFAQLTHFNDFTGRANGYVWLTPDLGNEIYRGPKFQASGFWSHYPTLYNVVLHELGHVMGFQHQAGIMGSSVPADAVSVRSEQLFSSKIYAAQRWTRTGNSVCGNVLASSAGIISKLLQAEVDDGGWSMCLSRDLIPKPRLKIKFRSSQGQEYPELILNQLTEYNVPALQSVTGYYLKNSRVQGDFPVPHEFISPNSDVVLGSLSIRTTIYSTTIFTSETEVRISLIDGASSSAGWISLYFPQSQSLKP